MGSIASPSFGVGNCASSLVQGVHYYRDADPTATVPGLMHVVFGEYHVRDVEFVAAFDVDDKKVGKDLAEAIGSSENNTIKIADVPTTGVTVQRGHTLDGLGKYYRQTIDESGAEPVDVVAALREAEVDVLVSYLPVGSENADKFYAQCAIDAGVAFVNALPVFIASDPEWSAKFEAAGVPVIGDDIKSQVGATITHRVMAKLFEDRGVQLDRTYQLNVGGNMDFKNMLERERLESKKISKTQAVTSNLTGALAGKTEDRNVHIGPSDYVAWLDDRKWAYVRLEGRAFGDVPLNLEYKLEVWDSPNSAGIIIDAIRAAKIAKDRGIGGALPVGVVLPHEVPPGAAPRRPSVAPASRPSSRAPRSAERTLPRDARRPRHRLTVGSGGVVLVIGHRSGCPARPAPLRTRRNRPRAQAVCSSPWTADGGAASSAPTPGTTSNSASANPSPKAGGASPDGGTGRAVVVGQVLQLDVGRAAGGLLREDRAIPAAGQLVLVQRSGEEADPRAAGLGGHGLRSPDEAGRVHRPPVHEVAEPGLTAVAEQRAQLVGQRGRRGGEERRRDDVHLREGQTFHG